MKYLVATIAAILLGIFFVLVGRRDLNDSLFWFFGGGVSVLNIYFVFMAIDIFTGYLKALKQHRWMSAINHVGLMTKFQTLITIFAAAVLDDIAPLIGIALPLNLAFMWTLLLILGEIGSVLENAYESGLKVDFLHKWLAVFNESVGKESTPPDYGDGQSETKKTIYQHKDQDQSKG
ncbi:phage holin family protein [Enterococcus casseliflavus]